ncbi:metal ABC transporter permease [Candidatus Liberibacter solanacearum]|uniref:Metal ABC transporter permease n=1 Tax=Candidatus Liberibacter solanacearum TaxID=556287 RepID=A0A3R7R8V6_9HYPH|nr:metal ABC transporter permease [Candidatus Liberibacter solanacearum]RPD36791.1 metal ABC transporter permease [Candidatus Liberibacter solanacearum]
MVTYATQYPLFDLLLEPFTYNYMTTAIWISMVIGCVCGLLSSYLILKGWSSIGNGISHAIFPGIVGCYKLGIPMSIGATMSGMLATSLMIKIKEKTKLQEDVSIAVVYLIFYSFAMFLLSLSPNDVYIESVFLGNVLSMSKADTLQILFIAFLVLSIVWIKRKDFILLFFDEAHAHSIGMNVKFLKNLFFSLLTITVVVGLQTVGLLLVIATVITPGATARLLTKSFGSYLFLSSFLGAASGFFGAYTSYFLDCGPGGMIVLIETALFLLSLLYFKQCKTR